MTSSILVPMVLMWVLTVAVWCYLFARRLPYLFALPKDINAVTPADVHDSAPAAVRTPSDNLKNLFELPVLFYAVVLFVVVTRAEDDIYLWCAWVFVIFRVGHSIVHCTFNHVSTRFFFYAVSTLALFGMVGHAAIAVVGQALATTAS